MSQADDRNRERSLHCADDVTPYRNGFELLDDLLQRLDRRIEKLTQQMQQEQDSVAQPSLLGVAITSADVSRLLRSDRQRPFAVHDAGRSSGLWEQVLPRIEATRVAGAVLPLDLLRHRFGLSALELDALIVCLAPELDRKYEKLYAYLNDDVARKHPTASLLLQLVSSVDVPDPRSLRLLSAESPLLRCSILSPVDEAPGTSLLAQGLYVERNVIRFLLEVPYLDTQVDGVRDGLVATVETRELWSRSAPVAEVDRVLESVLGECRDGGAQPVVCTIAGRPGSGRRYAVESVCQARGLALIALDCRLIAACADPEPVLRSGFRDAVMNGGPLLLTNAEALCAESPRTAALRHTLERLMDDHGSLLIATVDRPESLDGWFAGHARVSTQIPPSTFQDRTDQWSYLISRLELDQSRELAKDLAVRFRLTPGQIGEAFARASDAQSLAPEPQAWPRLLKEHAARVAAPRLGKLSRRVRSAYRLDDIVLPPRKRETLREVMRHVRYKLEVMQQWRFGETINRGMGLTVLFSGPPGTGKTMAAEILSNELGMELYCIDLAAVVSKYIGETEKNLAQIFDEAETSDAILFFDEADALFGKRSEVHDAHDRYANIETNYLLQRMESYEGIAILATNFRQNLDEAFLRRIRFVLEFPIPSADDRLRIWRKSLPEPVPLDDDVDFDFLAQVFDFTGGSIRNVTLNAAFLAAEDTPSRMSMKHLILSTQRELDKTGKRSMKEQFGQYFELLETAAGNGASRNKHH